MFTIILQALYFDRYQKLLAPDVDPLRDVRVRERLAEEVGGGRRRGAMGGKGGNGQGVIIDVEAISD